MAADANRLAAALAYEDERRRRLAETIPTLTGPTTAPRRSVRTDLENLSAGLGQGITTQLKGIKGLITDPVGTAKGAYEAARAVVRDPSVLAAALTQMGQKAMSGPLGAGEVIGEMIGPRKTGPVMAELDVYHGTPHRFPATEANPLGEFDASKIGTGEGAQAFGHGIYLAENPTIAKEYVKNPLNDVFLNERGEFLRQRLLQKQNDSQIISEYREKYNETPEEAAKDFQSLKKLMNESASFYKADLPDEMIDRMLDWDKPLSEQSQSVQKALQAIERFVPEKTGMEVLRDLRKELDQGLVDPEIRKRVVKTPELTAEETKIFNDLSKKRRAFGNLPESELKILHGLEDQLVKRNLEIVKAEKFAAINLAKKLNLSKEGMFMEGPALTSAVLRQAGIPGIRYLDAGSRGQGGSGTRNFVVFPGEEKKVRILERDGQKAPPQKIAQALETAPSALEQRLRELYGDFAQAYNLGLPDTPEYRRIVQEVTAQGPLSDDALREAVRSHPAYAQAGGKAAATELRQSKRGGAAALVDSLSEQGVKSRIETSKSPGSRSTYIYASKGGKTVKIRLSDHLPAESGRVYGTNDIMTTPQHWKSAAKRALELLEEAD